MHIHSRGSLFWLGPEEVVTSSFLLLFMENQQKLKLPAWVLGLYSGGNNTLIFAKLLEHGGSTLLPEKWQMTVMIDLDDRWKHEIVMHIIHSACSNTRLMNMVMWLFGEIMKAVLTVTANTFL